MNFQHKWVFNLKIKSWLEVRSWIMLNCHLIGSHCVKNSWLVFYDDLQNKEPAAQDTCSTNTAEQGTCRTINKEPVTMRPAAQRSLQEQRTCRTMRSAAQDTCSTRSAAQWCLQKEICSTRDPTQQGLQHKETYTTSTAAQGACRIRMSAAQGACSTSCLLLLR